MKEHMRMFHRPSYNVFQKIFWVNSNSIVQFIFSSDMTASVRELTDKLTSNITLAPAMMGQTLVDEFLRRVAKNLPPGSGSLPVVLIASCIVVLGVIAEAVIAYRTGQYGALVAWLLSELNKIIIKCSYRYKNVLSIIIRTFQLLGGKKSERIMSTMSLVQSPLESFAAFSHLSKYKSLDQLIQQSTSKKDMRASVNAMLDELDLSRAAQRMSTGFSVFTKKKKRGWFS
jgi:hypothetical protein